jgi:hypothetical protein
MTADKRVGCRTIEQRRVTKSFMSVSRLITFKRTETPYIAVGLTPKDSRRASIKPVTAFPRHAKHFL